MTSNFWFHKKHNNLLILTKISKIIFLIEIVNLILTRWILTSAHCLRHNIPLTVHLGIDENGGFFDKIEIPLANQHMHPTYSHSAFPPHDIGLYILDKIHRNRSNHSNLSFIFIYSKGLIELTRRLVPNSHIQAIQLSRDCGDELENVDAIAVGNGRTHPFNSYGDTMLRHIYLTTMSSVDCANRLKKFDKPFSVICAEPRSSQSIFRGDSGNMYIHKFG